MYCFKIYSAIYNQLPYKEKKLLHPERIHGTDICYLYVLHFVGTFFYIFLLYQIVFTDMTDIYGNMYVS